MLLWVGIPASLFGGFLMRSRRFGMAFVACLSFACLLANGSAVAGNFRVTPVRLDIGAFAKSGILTIQNDSADGTVVIQAKPLKWTQSDGQDVTVPTSELIVNPPIFTLKPGAQQVVRIGARDARLTEGNASELAYRLVLAEVPQAPSANFRGVNVALNISIPVFFAPTAMAVAIAPPQINASRDADGKINVNLINRSATSFKILKARLLDRMTQQPVAEIDSLRYALAGSFTTWTFKPLPVTNYTLSVLSDREVYTLEIDASTPPSLPATPVPMSGSTARERIGQPLR